MKKWLVSLISFFAMFSPIFAQNLPIDPQTVSSNELQAVLSPNLILEKEPIVNQKETSWLQQPLIPGYQFFGSASLLALTVPTRTTWYPGISMDVGFLCAQTPFCQKYQVRFLRTFGLFGFSSTDPDQERSRSSDLHLPFANVTLHGLEMTFSPRISMFLGNFQLLRSPVYLDEQLNFEHSLAALRVSFGKKSRTVLDTECFFDMSGPGVKYVSYASFQSVPFVGLQMIGIKQGCAVHAGKTIGGTLGYAIKSEVFVGKSGASVPDQEGDFGAILSEHRAGFYANIDFVPSVRIQQMGITGFHVGGFATLFFHLNQGCIYATAAPSLPCGSESQKFEPRLGLSFTLDFGGPKSSSSSYQNAKGLQPNEFSL